MVSPSLSAAAARAKLDQIGIGTGRDAVSIQLGGTRLFFAESYEVRRSITESQPGTFCLRVWSGEVAGQIGKRLPPNTPFKLFVGDVPMFSGTTDGLEYNQSGAATEINIRGRDDMAPLLDANPRAEIGYKNLTYGDLVRKTLDLAGIDGYQLATSNEANRKLTSGANPTQTRPPVTVGDVAIAATAGINPLVVGAINTITGPTRPTLGPVANVMMYKLGTPLWQQLKKHLDRAGLFLWCGPEKHFVLSAPNGAQNPLYRIVRQRGKKNNLVNVIAARHKNETTKRYSEATVYGRGGGKKFGRSKIHATFRDEEMIALGYDRPFVYHDVGALNVEQCVALCRRKIATTRRDGWNLGYSFAGHTTPVTGGGFAVWTPDTIADVQDMEYDISGLFYIDTVVFKANPQATTDVTLIRVEHLVYGSTDPSP